MLSGGELGALVVIDAVARLVPGVLGAAESADDESFAAGLLEYPQYTRPPELAGDAVPPVLASGNHAAIAAWRRAQAMLRTAARRPDLWRAVPAFRRRDQAACRRWPRERTSRSSITPWSIAPARS